jgi:cytochrome P450
MGPMRDQDATSTSTPTVDIDYHAGAFVSSDVSERMAAWNEVRRGCPVSWNEIGDGYWLLADYPSVHLASRDEATFLHAYDPDATDGVEYLGVIAVPRPPLASKFVIGETDGPFHAALRAGLNPHFTPTKAREIRTFLDQTANWLIDRFIERGTVEFIDELIAPATAIATLHTLGLPGRYWEHISNVFHRMAGHMGDADEMAYAVNVELPELRTMIVAELLDRREHPREDVATAIAQIEIDGRLLDEEELYLVVYNLASGGVDTTAGFTGLALWHMQTDLETRRTLQSQPELWDTATEEFLRLYGTVPSLARTMAADCEVGGQTLRRGEHVVIAHAAANRDPSEFARPDEFVIDRKRNRHLSFGLSSHRCLGSHLARVVFQSIAGAVLERMPDYDIDLDNAVLYGGSPSVIGVWSLSATFQPYSPLGVEKPFDDE